MQYSLLEVVQLQQDFPNISLFRGSTGTIIYTYMSPHEAYAVTNFEARAARKHKQPLKSSTIFYLRSYILTLLFLLILQCIAAVI